MSKQEKCQHGTSHLPLPTLLVTALNTDLLQLFHSCVLGLFAGLHGRRMLGGGTAAVLGVPAGARLPRGPTAAPALAGGEGFTAFLKAAPCKFRGM